MKDTTPNSKDEIKLNFEFKSLSIKAFPEVDGDPSGPIAEAACGLWCTNWPTFGIPCVLACPTLVSATKPPHGGKCPIASPTKEHCDEGTECNGHHTKCEETQICGICTRQTTECHCSNVKTGNDCKGEKPSCMINTNNCATDNTCDKANPNTGGCGCTEWENTHPCKKEPTKPCTQKASWPVPVPEEPKKALQTALLGALREQLQSQLDSRIVS